MNEPPTRQGWTRLPHTHPPRPTYFPAALALGAAFIFWGLVTSVVIMGLGAALFFAALAGWIREIRHESKDR